MNQKYEIIRKIGNEGCQKYLGKRKSDGLQVLIKKILYGDMSSKQKQQLVEEVNNLSQIKSNHVVKYYQYFINKQEMEIYVVMQYIKGNTLQFLIQSYRSQGKFIAQNYIWNILMQIVLGLNDIHYSLKAKIIHRNLKPSSIAYFQENIKIADFGHLRKLNPDQQFSTTQITETFYLSPQQLCQGLFTIKTDIWAIGCLLYELTTLRKPFDAKNQFEMANKIKQGNIEPISNIYSKQLSRVITVCLRKNPDLRPSANDLLYLPEISRRLKEKRNQENIIRLKNRQKQIIEKEKELEQLQKQIYELQINNSRYCGQLKRTKEKSLSQLSKNIMEPISMTISQVYSLKNKN